jgi:hypothetical protein
VKGEDMKSCIRIGMMCIYVVAVYVKIVASFAIKANKLQYKFNDNKKPAHKGAYNKKDLNGAVMRKECPHAYYLLIYEPDRIDL